MRKFILSILLTFSGFILQAQDFKQFFITTGGAFGTHQNQTFSQSALSGGGIGFAIGGEKQANNLFRWQLDAPIQFYKIDKLDHTKTTILAPTLSFTWMRGIKNEGANKLYVGGDLEGSLLFRNSSNLDNNGKSIFYNNTLAVATRLEKPLGIKWRLGLEASLGLISWVKASDGFAFSVAQKYLENGEFNYLDDPTGKFYKYGELATIGKFNRIKTDISLFQDGDKARWGVKYNWNLKAYEPFREGQIVQGTHGLKFFVGFKLGRKKAVNKDKK